MKYRVHRLSYLANMKMELQPHLSTRHSIRQRLMACIGWQCRDTSDSDVAQAERAAYLQENGWLAANSRMGKPNELEYQIKLPEVSYRIAVSVFRSFAPDERVVWPSALTDDTTRPNPGGLPTELHFLPEQWAIVGNGG
jgi:hypothetical protein